MHIYGRAVTWKISRTFNPFTVSAACIIERIGGWTRTRKNRNAAFARVANDRIRRLSVLTKPHRKISGPWH